MARKYGMKSGYVEALNIKSGTVTVASGDANASVTFDESMENAPAVQITPAQAGTGDAYVPAADTTASGFTVEGVTDADEEVYHYIAIDESRY